MNLVKIHISKTQGLQGTIIGRIHSRSIVEFGKFFFIGVKLIWDIQSVFSPYFL